MATQMKYTHDELSLGQFWLEDYSWGDWKDIKKGWKDVKYVTCNHGNCNIEKHSLNCTTNNPLCMWYYAVIKLTWHDV